MLETIFLILFVVGLLAVINTSKEKEPEEDSYSRISTTYGTTKVRIPKTHRLRNPNGSMRAMRHRYTRW